jgi:hypothetical protein
MAGEGKFALGGENPETRKRAIIRRLLHKNCFRKIHLSGDGLHALLRNVVTVGNDGERIAGEGLGREYIELV